MTTSNASILVSLHSGKARTLKALDARIARARTLASKILLGYLRADVESL